MAQPYDYSINIQNPIPAFAQAYQLGAGIAEQNAAREAAKIKAQQEAERSKLVSQAFDEVHRNPTAENYANLSNLLPDEQAKSVREAFSLLDKDKQQTALREAGNVYAAFASGNTDAALGMIEEKIEAYRNAGNTEKVKELEMWKNMASSGEDGAKATEDFFGFSLSMIPGGKDTIESINKFADERRKQKEHPILLQQEQAELDKAESEAEREAIKAKYAEKVEIAELEKYAADNGLTKEQTNEAIARTKKLGAETAKLLMELEALKNAGGIPPEKKFEQEEKIRKEYNARVQNFTDMKQTYSNIQASASDASGAGDVALVTGFMKMLDPGSVVRESEFATARDTSGLLTKLQSIAKKVESGQFLSPQQRKDFADLAGQYMKGAETHEKKVRDDLGNVVKSYGLTPENVFGNVAGGANIAELRTFIKQNNPRAKGVDSMTEEQIAATFPNGYSTYKQRAAPTQNAAASQKVSEVDY